MLKTDTIINGDCLEVLKVCRMKVSIVVLLLRRIMLYGIMERKTRLAGKAHRRNISDIWFLCFVN